MGLSTLCAACAHARVHYASCVTERRRGGASAHTRRQYGHRQSMVSKRGDTWMDLMRCGAEGGNRTPTPRERDRILSPARLPVPPLRHACGAQRQLPRKAVAASSARPSLSGGSHYTCCCSAQSNADGFVAQARGACRSILRPGTQEPSSPSAWSSRLGKGCDRAQG